MRAFLWRPGRDQENVRAEESVWKALSSLRRFSWIESTLRIKRGEGIFRVFWLEWLCGSIALWQWPTNIKVSLAKNKGRGIPPVSVCSIK